MTEREYYSDFSKVHKYGDGKAKIKIGWITWKGREWIDLRLFRRTDDGYVHTQKGVRLTPNISMIISDYKQQWARHTPTTTSLSSVLRSAHISKYISRYRPNLKGALTYTRIDEGEEE